MPVIDYYTRKGCHLCDIMLEELMPLVRGQVDIAVRDIDTRPEWREKYNIRVPVIESQGRLISGYPLDRQALSLFLAGIAESPE